MAGPLRFDNCELDLDRFELRVDGKPAKLERIPMELLALLVRAEGRLVEREHIIEKLWGKDVFLDTEHGINTAIRKIRSALNDDPARPKFIETVVGKGYRFAAAAPVVVSQKDRVPQTARTNYARWSLVLVLVLLGALSIPAWLRFKSGPPIGKRVILAVLPFTNMTGSPQQDFLSDGVTEEMITQLGRLNPDQLGVIARSSSLQLSKAEHPIEKAARDLHADYVLEGSVRREGNHVRTTVQLIRTSDQTHVWARDFDDQLGDVLNLQLLISQQTAEQIGIAIVPRTSRSSEASAEAVEAYLHGREAWNRRNAKSLAQAVEYFQEAIALAPSYSRPYSGLADALAALGYQNLQPPRTAFEAAKQAALKSVSLDPESAEGHTSLAYVLTYLDYDFVAAEKEFRRALLLNPSYAVAHQWFGVMLLAQGRATESQSELEAAQKLDPLSAAVVTDLGFYRFVFGKNDEAIAQLKRALLLNPNFPLVHLWLGRTYENMGKLKDAEDELLEYQRLAADSPVPAASLAHLYALSDRKRADKAIQAWKKSRPAGYMPEYGTALVDIAAGDQAKALAGLQRAIDVRENWVVWMKMDPRVGPLRGRPEYNALLRQVHLEP